MAHPGVSKKQFLLAACLLASSLTFGTSSTTTAGGLPGGYYMQLYSTALQSSFGTPPYTYAVVSGGLPPGVTMNSAGKIAGTPSDTGTFSFQVKASDSSKPSRGMTFGLLSQHPHWPRYLWRFDRSTRD